MSGHSNSGFVSRVWSTLPRRERYFVGATLLIRLGLVALDLLGIFLIGAVVSLLSGTRISNQSAFGQILQFFTASGLKNSYAGVLVIALVFFIAKGVVSAYLISKTGSYIANLEGRKSGQVFGSLIAAHLETIEETGDQDLIYSTTESVNSATTRAVLTGSAILSEGSLLVAISVYLAVADFWLFVSMCAFFGFVGLIMNRFITRASARAAREMHRANLESKSFAQEALNSLRQVSISPNRNTMPEVFSEQRLRFAHAHSSFQTINGLPRYITEIAVLVGVSLLVLQRAIGGIDSASATVISMFLVGIFRIVSSMLPLQAALSGWKHLKFEAAGALNWLEGESPGEVDLHLGIGPTEARQHAPLSVEVRSLTYIYPEGHTNALDGVNLVVNQGEFVALVGGSGSGKSTLADCIVGLRQPQSGSVLINGMECGEYIRENPGDVAYVPQNATAFSASIRENVSFNFGSHCEGESGLVIEALRLAGLGDFLDNTPAGIEYKIGDGNNNLSGGQLQRLAIARALYLKPRLLVLDEATSALDSQTQEVIQSTIEKLRGKVTLVVIAHRRETIQDADRVVRLDDGVIRG